MQFDLGRPRIAIADYTLALARDPALGEAYLNRGLSQHALGRDAEARADLVEALRVKPDLGLANLHLGAMELEHDRLDASERHFQRALALGLEEGRDGLMEVRRRRHALRPT